MVDGNNYYYLREYDGWKGWFFGSRICDDWESESARLLAVLFSSIFYLILRCWQLLPKLVLKIISGVAVFIQIPIKAFPLIWFLNAACCSTWHNQGVQSFSKLDRIELICDKMRTLIRAVGQFRPALRFRGKIIYEGSSRTRDFWFNMDHRSIYSLSRSIDDFCQSRYTHTIHRAMSTDVATLPNGGCILFYSILQLKVGLCWASKSIHFCFIWLIYWQN